VTNLVLCCITFVSFTDDGPLRAETCSSVQLDIVISISKKQRCVYCSSSVVNRIW